MVEALYKENEELRNLYIIAAVAGQGPDLIYGPADNVGVLVTTQTIRPLDEIFGAEFFARFVPQGLVDWKGSHWLAADQIGNHLTLVYNKALVPEPPKTLDELIATGQPPNERRQRRRQDRAIRPDLELSRAVFLYPVPDRLRRLGDGRGRPSRAR